MSQMTQELPEHERFIMFKDKETELATTDYDIIDEGNFEQHAHKPTLSRTQSALAEHLGEAATGCKREFIEPARTVEEQCTAIIGNTPWPYSICWLCGFPVGQQTEPGPTMLQSIASLMRINCLFVNPLSARWDKQTCEHVNPINIAGTAWLNKGVDGYANRKHVLNIRMEYESAHDFCNILKNEGYLITLESGTIKMSFKGLTVAEWQIKAWPNFLLNGSMNGPSLSSVICFVRTNARGEMQKVFLKSPIHGYLFLKLLAKMDDANQDLLFAKLQPRDELADTYDLVSGNIVIPGTSYSNSKDSHKSVSTYFSDYVTSRQPKKKKNANPRSAIGSIHNIYSIASINNRAFQTSVIGIVDTWKEAIKKAMRARTQIFVDFIDRVDQIVGDGLLWDLMKTSTQQSSVNRNDGPLTYQQLDERLQVKLAELRDNNRALYNNIAVPVQTYEEKKSLYGKASLILGLSSQPLNQGKGSKKRLTQREKMPQPVAGLPVSMSLADYTQPKIFKFKVLEQQKNIALGIAYEGVAASLYDPAFMRTLKAAVETGELINTGELTDMATDAMARAESKCIPDEIFRNRNQSQRRSHSRNGNQTRRHSRSRSRSRSPLRGSPRRESHSHTRRRSHSRSLSRSLSQPRRRNGGYTRRLKK
jgi:hypothetical protein